MLKPAEFQALLAKIRLLIPAEKDDGETSALLMQVQDSYAEVLTAHDEQVTQIAGLSERNDSLRKYNEELFFRVGQKDPEPEKEPTLENEPPAVSPDEILGAYA